MKIIAVSFNPKLYTGDKTNVSGYESMETPSFRKMEIYIQKSVWKKCCENVFHNAAPWLKKQYWMNLMPTEDTSL